MPGGAWAQQCFDNDALQSVGSSRRSHFTRAKGDHMRSGLFLMFVAALAFAVAGCGSKQTSGGASASSGSSSSSGGNQLSGTYHGQTANATFDFKPGNKVTANVMGDSKDLSYKVEGDKVTILNPKEGDIVLTRNQDGSLNSELGVFTKNAQ
jgi:hypothetical protein